MAPSAGNQQSAANPARNYSMSCTTPRSRNNAGARYWDCTRRLRVPRYLSGTSLISPTGKTYVDTASSELYPPKSLLWQVLFAQFTESR